MLSLDYQFVVCFGNSARKSPRLKTAEYSGLILALSPTSLLTIKKDK